MGWRACALSGGKGETGMSPGETVLTMVVGGALSMLGGVLAQFLNYRFESRTWMRELMKERLEETRRLAQSHMDLVAAIRTVIASEWPSPGTKAWDEVWLDILGFWSERWKDAHGGGSAVVGFTDDEELRENLAVMMSKGSRLGDLCQQVASKGEVPEWAATACHESEHACMKVLARADEVLRRV